MIRFATLLFVLTWNTAMATDAVQNFGMPLRPPTPTEQFDASPRGQELQAIAGMSGPEGNAAYEAYRQKYGIQGPARFRLKRGPGPLTPQDGSNQ